MSGETKARPTRIGAVAYDPKVVTIWEGFKAYFDKHGLDTDFILYSNYDAQVDANLNGEIDIAWNSPLAWVHSQLLTAGRCRALAMRNSDLDLTTKVIVRKQAPFAALTDLKQKIVAVGASDSPQSTLIPLNLIAAAGVVPGRDCQVVYHNVMVGKHGDHVGGERDAARALAAGDADAACILDSNYVVFINEGTVDPGTTRVLASTPPFDHCNFTAAPGVAEDVQQRFVETLLGMSAEDPDVRTCMDLEGVKQWLPARTSGYSQLEQAVERFGFYKLAANATGE
jgi:ABC-type phosphate/phosphonate transport system substrate-binding protein